MPTLLNHVKHFFGLSSPDDFEKKKTVRFGDPSSTGNGRIFSLLSLILLIAVWVIVCELEIVPPLFWPPPQEVFARFYEIATEGYRGHTLWGHIGVSMLRILAGFILGCLLGKPLRTDGSVRSTRQH